MPTKLEDDVPEEVKESRAAQIMEAQERISWELNQQKVGKTLTCMIDRKEGNYFVGRSEFDSPDVDNEVWVPADTAYLRIGEFADVQITEASDFDLYGQAVLP